MANVDVTAYLDLNVEAVCEYCGEDVEVGHITYNKEHDSICVTVMAHECVNIPDHIK